MDEFTIINKYLSPLTKKNDGSFNLKDDIFIDKSKKIAISVDTFIENVHFVKNKDPKYYLKKILRASLSDLVCKGVVPTNYFISCGLNKDVVSKKWLNKLKSTLKQEQIKYNITLSGGDTVRSPRLVISIIVLGNYVSKPVLRSGAKSNNDIYVTGNIGDSYIGLNIIKKKFNFGKLNPFFTKRYYEPDLQINFSRYLSRIASSSIDISDGLAHDLKHLCDNSKCGAFINLNFLPLSLKCKLLIRKKKIHLKKIFSRGDDYQILFTSNCKNRSKIAALSKKINTKISRIGYMRKKRGIIFKYNSKVFRLNAKEMGYIHNF